MLNSKIFPFLYKFCLFTLMKIKMRLFSLNLTIKYIDNRSLKFQRNILKICQKLMYEINYILLTTGQLLKMSYQWLCWPQDHMSWNAFQSFLFAPNNMTKFLNKFMIAFFFQIKNSILTLCVRVYLLYYFLNLITKLLSS